MTQAELNEFEAENDELIAMFQRRKPTMDTVERMFPGLYRDPECEEPIVDDMELVPCCTKMEINADGWFVVAIYMAMAIVFLVTLFGWLL